MWILCSLLQMANMEAETTERNKQNERFASLTDSDLDMLLIEKDAASTRRTTNGAVKVFRLYLREKGLPETLSKPLPQIWIHIFPSYMLRQGNRMAKSTREHL